MRRGYAEERGKLQDQRCYCEYVWESWCVVLSCWGLVQKIDWRQASAAGYMNVYKGLNLWCTDISLLVNISHFFSSIGQKWQIPNYYLLKNCLISNEKIQLWSNILQYVINYCHYIIWYYKVCVIVLNWVES